MGEKRCEGGIRKALENHKWGRYPQNRHVGEEEDAGVGPGGRDMAGARWEECPGEVRKRTTRRRMGGGGLRDGDRIGRKGRGMAETHEEESQEEGDGQGKGGERGGQGGGGGCPEKIKGSSYRKWRIVSSRRLLLPDFSLSFSPFPLPPHNCKILSCSLSAASNHPEGWGQDFATAGKRYIREDGGSPLVCVYDN